MGTGIGEGTAGGDVPLMVTETGEGARFQNELPGQGKCRAEDGGARSGETSLSAPRSGRRDVPTRSIGTRRARDCG